MNVFHVVSCHFRTFRSLEDAIKPPKSFNDRYYVYPDGKDAAGKMMVANAYALIGGLVISTYDVVMISKPVGFGNILAKYMYNTGRIDPEGVLNV